MHPLRALLLLLVVSSCQCGDVRLGNLRVSLSVSPESLDFGAVEPGQQVVRPLTFENISRGALEVTALELEGEAAEHFDVAPKRPFRLEPGQSRTIDAIYQPRAQGVHAARLRVESTSSGGAALLVPFVGVTPLEVSPLPDGGADGGGSAGGSAGGAAGGGAATGGGAPTCAGGVLGCSAGVRGWRGADGMTSCSASFPALCEGDTYTATDVAQRGSVTVRCARQTLDFLAQRCGAALPDAGAPVVDAGTPPTPDAGSGARPECGPANGTDVTSQPIGSELCTAGVATQVTGVGPWRWDCTGNGPTAQCSTARYWVTEQHEELRSVILGQPSGAQRYVSNMTRAQFVNNTGAPVQVVIRLVDPLQRFLWNNNVPQAQRPEVTATVAAFGRVNPSVLWNSNDDTGTAADPCNQLSGPVGIDYLVGGLRIGHTRIHAMGRPPYSCPGGMVSWSDSAPNSGGPCRAMAPSIQEYNLPDAVFASSSLSDPGFQGKQGISCVATQFATDRCGVSVPVAGGAVYAFAKFSGPDACRQ